MLGNTQIIFRLLMGAALGGLVGFERERHNRRIAGFRTHILVCVGSTLIMLTSLYVFDMYAGLAPVDPARIAAGVVTGIGFLGAGTIIRSGSTVTGLTTAASLWTVSGIGLASGCGFHVAAVVTTIIVLAALYLLRKLPIDRELLKGGSDGKEGQE
ncbi:MAG: MgtC/SapB family protein [Candidatus Omnitrophica bacterium]|nr:MgtC/SapB family protein [Candidatus Omnitrophota bacterium]MBU4457538.1 MgtC/SapB family protein [Candidatus Omnitrophota bacterium]